MSGSQIRADFTVARAEFDVAVAFEVDAGGCVAMLGPNGSGKSTILAALAGLTPMTSGRLVVDGTPLEEAGRLRRPPEARRIALLDQRARLFPHLTVRANIAFGPRARGRGRREVRAAVDDWIERIGLVDRADAKPHELSGGQQQRVAIARAFASAPRVVLLDEPFAALDAESAPIVRRVLADELAGSGTTAVLVTHEMSDAWQWAGQCLMLHRGAVVESGTPADLTLAPRRAFTAALSGFDVVRGRWRDGALDTGRRALPGTREDDVREGDAVVGIVAPGDVDVSPPDDAGHASVLTAVSVTAGVVRIETDSGLHAELPIENALRTGGGALPLVGDRYVLTPHGMRVVADVAGTDG